MSTKKLSTNSSAPPYSEQQDWRAESDHRTMSDAAEIQQDPKRMVGVRKHHRKMKKSMSMVQRQMTQKGRR